MAIMSEKVVIGFLFDHSEIFRFCQNWLKNYPGIFKNIYTSEILLKMVVLAVQLL